MLTEIFSVRFTPAVKRKLADMAAASGLDTATMVRYIVHRFVTENPGPLAGKAFKEFRNEIPRYKAMDSSGIMSDEEVKEAYKK